MENKIVEKYEVCLHFFVSIIHNPGFCDSCYPVCCAKEIAR